MPEPPRAGARRRSAGKRRPLWLILGLLAALFAVLSLSVRQTEVTVEAVVSGLAFTVAERQPLAAPHQDLLLAAVEATGVREIRFPSTETALSAAASGSPHELRLRAAGSDDDPAVLALDPPIAAVDRRFRVTAGADGASYRMDLECPAGDCVAMDFQLNLQGKFDALVPSAGASRLVEFASPRAVRLVASDDDAPALELWPPPGTSPLVAWQVAVGELSFDDLEHLELPDARPVVRRFSTVESGVLRFGAVPGRERDLHPGERLRFDVVAGTLHSVRFEAGSLRVVFSGSVDDVRVGNLDRSLMPSWLEVYFSEEWFRFVCGLLVSAVLIALGFRHTLEIES